MMYGKSRVLDDDIDAIHVTSDSNMPHRAVAIYRYLKDRANKEGKRYTSIGTIANDLKLSRSTVKRAIDDLVKTGTKVARERRQEQSHVLLAVDKHDFPQR